MSSGTSAWIVMRAAVSYSESDFSCSQAVNPIFVPSSVPSFISLYSSFSRIFTYGFQKSVDAFKEANVNLVTLSNYNVLVEQAKEIGYISESDIEVLKQWRTSPDTWKK